jgi:hypothetical protein
LLLVTAAIVGWMYYDARPKAALFPLKTPPTAQLLNSFKHRGGFDDWTYAFEFAAQDGQLRDLLIREWDLLRYADMKDPTSWANGLSEVWAIKWWPPAEKLSSAPERYGREHFERAQYWSVWYDPAGERLYVEYGNW